MGSGNDSPLPVYDGFTQPGAEGAHRANASSLCRVHATRMGSEYYAPSVHILRPEPYAQ